MTRIKRLLIVARHYWPTSNDLSMYQAALAGRLRRSGCECVVVTPRWHASWPQKIRVDEVPVIRLDPPPVSKLRQNNYGRSLSRFVEGHASQFDAILCSQADWEALEVIQTATRRHIPVWVCVDPNAVGAIGSEADRWGLRSSPTVRACRLASMVLVTSQSAHQQILAHGISPEKVLRLPVWQPPPVDYSRDAREAAKRALRNINYELTTDKRSRVLLVPGELTPAWGVDFLIDSIWQLLDEQPHLKIWLHGDGSMREKVYRKLKSYGVHRSVVMPGMFSSMEPILQAADACLFPRATCGNSWLLPTCIASGIPVMAVRTQELVSCWGPSATSLTFSPDSPIELRDKLESYLENFDSWAHATREAARFVRRQIWESDLRLRLNEAAVKSLPDAFWGFVELGNDSMRLAE